MYAEQQTVASTFLFCRKVDLSVYVAYHDPVSWLQDCRCWLDTVVPRGELNGPSVLTAQDYAQLIKGSLLPGEQPEQNGSWPQKPDGTTKPTLVLQPGARFSERFQEVENPAAPCKRTFLHPVK